MSVCEKCWGDAYLRHLANPQKTQAEHYRELLEERKDRPCTPGQQAGIVVRREEQGMSEQGEAMTMQPSSREQALKDALQWSLNHRSGHEPSCNLNQQDRWDEAQQALSSCPEGPDTAHAQMEITTNRNRCTCGYWEGLKKAEAALAHTQTEPLPVPVSGERIIRDALMKNNQLEQIITANWTGGESPTQTTNISGLAGGIAELIGEAIRTGELVASPNVGSEPMLTTKEANARLSTCAALAELDQAPPTVNSAIIGTDGREHFRVTAGCYCGWSIINDFEWEQHLKQVKPVAAPAVIPPFGSQVEDFIGLSEEEVRTVMKIPEPAATPVPARAEIETRLLDIVDTYCGCDAMRGSTCNVHTKVALLRQALQQETARVREVLPLDVIETILHVLNNDFTNATDNVQRGQRQQERMPYDHDNNDAQIHHLQWQARTKKAIEHIRALKPLTAAAQTGETK